MKSKALICVLLLSLFLSISFAAVDCSDPKNRPRDIAGRLVGGIKSAIVILMPRKLNVI